MYQSYKFSFYTVITAFFLYFSLQMFLVPSLYIFFFGSEDKYALGITTLFFSTLTLFLCTLPFALWNTKTLSFQRIVHLIKKALLFLLAIFPLSFIVANLIFLLLNLFSSTPLEPIDQEAVYQMKSFRDDFVRFWTLAILISTLIPIAEETLFRGLLQNYLLRYLPPFFGIALTSSIFAAFHITQGQGATNFPIFGSLFLLSCFLGYFYNKEKTLLASVLLHGLFNGLTVAFIYLDVV